ncbi:uncharacterized protein L201_001025 [Kwoniella dendrophila CBS 6074]|uniref:C2H2-type domain-containing protein n=1 Tax=Kwoniella dendrophila CBS 6074 TaxID=1295534 RepID=A0AAX4JL54_9TREE
MGNCFAPLSPGSSDSEGNPAASSSRRPQITTTTATNTGSPSEQRIRAESGSNTNQDQDQVPIQGRPERRKSRLNKHSRSSSILSLGKSININMGGGPPLDALRNYATLANPSQSLSASKLLLTTRNTIAVFDQYPKAKYHFLVLPRYPFTSQLNPDSKKSIVPLDTLNDLKSLLLKADRESREEILLALENTSREVEEMIRDEMLKTEGFEWKIDIGFHAIPSMKHVHLHVISDDRISPSLKTKKHHNSFRPDLGFFIDIMEVKRWIEDDSNMRERVDAMYDAKRLLDTPLTCHKCDEFMTNVPKLKTHLEKHFQEERATALNNIARHGRQRSSDEEMF